MWSTRSDPWAGAIGMLALMLSKAFVEYSTSGLENPLTHLLLVWFLLALAGRSLFLGRARGGSGHAEPDGPRADRRAGGLLLAWTRYGVRRGFPAVAAGFLPFFAWELFALLYYGSPFPNTSPAKLNTGIDGLPMAAQGLRYLANFAANDPPGGAPGRRRNDLRRAGARSRRAGRRYRSTALPGLRRSDRRRLHERPFSSRRRSSSRSCFSSMAPRSGCAGQSPRWRSCCSRSGSSHPSRRR